MEPKVTLRRYVRWMKATFVYSSLLVLHVSDSSCCEMCCMFDQQ